MAEFASDGFVILWLVVLEGLLSVDNALVLAAMVSVLPENQRKKALLYGILGAYVFRILAILFAVALLKVWWLKVLGGLYLLYLGFSGLRGQEEKKSAVGASNQFWPVVLRVELMDLAFSIDSILAAVALTSKIWLVVLGGMLGILIMRLVAGIFIRFLEKHQLFKKTAYILILVIGAKLGISPWWHPQEWLFFGILLLVFLGTFVVEKIKK